MLLKDTWKEIVCWTGLQLIEIMKEIKRKKNSKNSFKKNSSWQLLLLWIKNFYVIKNLISNLFKKSPNCMIKNLVKRNFQFLKLQQTIQPKSQQ